MTITNRRNVARAKGQMMKTNMTTLKTLGFTFLLYVALTVTGAIVLTGIWQTGADVNTLSHQQLTMMAAQSDMINLGSAVIGALAAVVCAMFATRRTPGAPYRPAMYFALLLVAYGVLGIVLHPEHSVIQQIGKLVTPVPLCLAGAWLARQLFSDKQAQRVQAG